MCARRARKTLVLFIFWCYFLLLLLLASTHVMATAVLVVSVFLCACACACSEFVFKIRFVFHRFALALENHPQFFSAAAAVWVSHLVVSLVIFVKCVCSCVSRAHVDATSVHIYGWSINTHALPLNIFDFSCVHSNDAWWWWWWSPLAARAHIQKKQKLR